MEHRAANRNAVLVCILLAVSTLGGCAHTKPIGQSLVALGALAIGFAALDAAGVLGSDCVNTRVEQGQEGSICGGNAVHPKAIDLIALGSGVGLLGGGIALWTTDVNANAPPPSQTSTVSSPRAFVPQRLP